MFVLVVTLGLLPDLSRVQAGEIRLNFDSIIELDIEAGLITLPLFREMHGGDDVWYVIFDASDRDVAEGQLGVNWAPIMANALGSAAVQDVTVVYSVVQFEGTVDVSPARILVPNLVTGFPPDVAEPGSIGDADYSPLITKGVGDADDIEDLLEDCVIVSVGMDGAAEPEARWTEGGRVHHELPSGG